jgi:hypothetical protein
MKTIKIIIIIIIGVPYIILRLKLSSIIHVVTTLIFLLFELYYNWTRKCEGKLCFHPKYDDSNIEHILLRPDFVDSYGVYHDS